MNSILLEYVPNSDAEWCNEIDCSTKVGKTVCYDTCKKRGIFLIDKVIDATKYNHWISRNMFHKYLL